MGRPVVYPNHILHPEVIPSFNDVPGDLIKRRNIRFTDPAGFDSFETELPMAIASSLQDELERAVQHRFEDTLCLALWTLFFSTSRAAQDRNTDQQSATIPSSTEQKLFQALSPEQSQATSRVNEACEYNQQASLPRAPMNDKSSVREAFQRIKIAGDLQDMSHIEDLEDAVGPLLRAMVIREKWAEFR